MIYCSSDFFSPSAGDEVKVSLEFHGAMLGRAATLGYHCECKVGGRGGGREGVEEAIEGKEWRKGGVEEGRG